MGPNIGQIEVGFFERRYLRILGRAHGACKVRVKVKYKALELLG